MNVYVESNFVLELALRQEQFTSCEKILALCEEGKVRLVVPAYFLAEPYETLTRREKQRKRMKVKPDQELGQIARTDTYADREQEFRDLTALLINVTDEANRRLEEVRSRLMEAAEIIALDVNVLTASTTLQRVHDFVGWHCGLAYAHWLGDVPEIVAVSNSDAAGRGARAFGEARRSPPRRWPPRPPAAGPR